MEIIQIIVLFFMSLIDPFFYFIAGWISGWLLKIAIGNIMVSGLALMHFNLSINDLPLFFGILSIIVSFFNHKFWR